MTDYKPSKTVKALVTLMANNTDDSNEFRRGRLAGIEIALWNAVMEEMDTGSADRRAIVDLPFAARTWYEAAVVEEREGRRAS